MALKIPFAGADLLGISDPEDSLGLTVLSNTQNSPPPGMLSIGNQMLGADAGFETGPQGQPGTDEPAPINLLGDIGHGRIEALEIYALGNNAGAAFQEGDSTYQSNPAQGGLLDGDLANGFDGNNIENVHAFTIVQAINAVATWDNSGDTDSSPTPVDALSPHAHADALAGLGGGNLHDVTVGGTSLLDGNGLGDLFN